MTDESMTVSGRRVHLLDMKRSDIDIDDIAHHLSMTCRFGGGIERWYSNAQHSLLVSALCEALPGKHQDHGKKPPLAGLLHDSPETYLQDLSRPTKNAIRLLACGLSSYDQLTKMVTLVIEQEFGLEGAFTDPGHPICHVVETADKHALVLEDFVLRPHAQVKLGPMLVDLRRSGFGGYADTCERLARELEDNLMPPLAAKKPFLARYFELTEASP